MNDTPYILYIEDDRPMVELVRQALRLTGYEVQSAASGVDGLEMMRERKPNVLLLDLMMPDINGWEVYRQMKDDPELQDIPVMVVTASVPEHGRIIIEGLPPVDDYITKPFDIEHLIRSVKRLL